MAIKKYNLTQQQIAVEESEDPKEYYYKIFNAKKNGEAWAKDIPCDMAIYFADQERCHICGKPDMDEQVTGSECKRCGTQRLIDIYGYTKESAEIEYSHRQERKEKSMTFYEMARKKKVSNTKRDETEDLPF